MAAAKCQRFTVEGDPSDVFALAESQGWKITRLRWWQRTYAVPRWSIWLFVILNTPRTIEWIAGLL